MKFRLAVAIWAGLLLAQPLLLTAQNHPPPPPPPGGSIIFDPGATPGITPLPTGYTQYTASFTATLTTTDVTFAFRHDPGFFALDDVSATTGVGPNLITNGGFETGSLAPWSYDNKFGVSFAGVVSNGCQGLPNFDGSFVWCDGATQGYDAIDQKISTTIGDTYTVKFFLDDIDETHHSTGFFQDLSTDGLPETDGDATGVLVYAGATPPPPTTPEPGTLTMFGSAVLGLAGLWRRKLVR